VILDADLYFVLPGKTSASAGWAAALAALRSDLSAVFDPRGRMSLSPLATPAQGFAVAKSREEQLAAPVAGESVRQSRGDKLWVQ
jgi:hypothetical protein